MEGHGDLYQSLKKFLVLGRCSAPNIFEGFVSVEELGLVEQVYSVNVILGRHTSFWHRAVCGKEKTL